MVGKHRDSFHRNWLRWCRPDLCGLELGLVAGSCEHGNESSSFTKSGDFLGQLRNCYFLKNESDPRS